MKTWNVRLATVHLVDAPSGPEAISKARTALTAAGFDVLDDDTADAFESEGD